MTDPLSEIVALLQPEAAFSKISSAAGPWQVRRVEAGRPFYGVILEGACRLAIEGREPLILEAGDFLLIPASSGFAMSSAPPPERDIDSVPTMLPSGEYRLGRPDGPPDVRMLVGYCTFGSPDAALLVSLLPELVHVRGEQRLSTLVQLVIEESRTQRPAREVILSRLLEVLLIEALRSTTGTTASPGLLNGLADARLAAAIRCMHESPTRAWTVAQLAKEAALSRSAFFERFSRAVGVPPMEYLLAWRMALAKRLLQRDGVGIADVAERVGYSSASTFSVAFTRHVGLPPARYAREHTAARE
ncbi:MULTISPECIES: AraC family transcriptional regulator [unclassified Dyella]|uniref:AraC family transcriptional regulator n=1 Tax=unclassified Dyella TaxID=2634549 RepID=UPI000C83FAC8|nr:MULTISPECIES: AraC family transcriptional regulator [unclassified Dyella]MDR3445446.1 AraC family transcriptional regulator [Dyella sp.]PMQ02655.1 RCS-specific HTH-type transcriptional activator RclR [Dyella sp. AD56]